MNGQNNIIGYVEKRIEDNLSSDDQKEIFQATPLADTLLFSQTVDILQMALKTKNVVRGINETLKAIGKERVDMVIMAADTDPIELLCNLPPICEESSIPYLFVPCSAILGRAVGLKRPVICCGILNDLPEFEKSQVAQLKNRVELILYS